MEEKYRGVQLKDLSDADAEKVLVDAGFPPGSARIAKAGWSGYTEATPQALKKLLADAEAEAAAQQQI